MQKFELHLTAISNSDFGFDNKTQADDDNMCKEQSDVNKNRFWLQRIRNRNVDCGCADEIKRNTCDSS